MHKECQAVGDTSSPLHGLSTPAMATEGRVPMLMGRPADSLLTDFHKPLSHNFLTPRSSSKCWSESRMELASSWYARRSSSVGGSRKQPSRRDWGPRLTLARQPVLTNNASGRGSSRNKLLIFDLPPCLMGVSRTWVMPYPNSVSTH